MNANRIGVAIGPNRNQLRPLRVLVLGQPSVDKGQGAQADSESQLAFDLKVFFSTVPKEPTTGTTADELTFLEAQHCQRQGPRVVRPQDCESGWTKPIGHLSPVAYEALHKVAQPAA